MGRAKTADHRAGGSGLPPRRQRFVEEYLIDLNATQAAIRAGYSPRTARSIGSRLLGEPVIRARVDAALAERSRRTAITQDQVLREYARLAFSDLRQVAHWGPEGLRVLPSATLDDDSAAALAEVHETRTGAGGTVRVKLHEKKSALDALARHLGLFVEREAGSPAVLTVCNSIDLSGASAEEAKAGADISSDKKSA